MDCPLIAHSTLLEATTFVANLQSERLSRRAAAGTTTSCVTPELWKCVVSNSSKVYPSDRVCPPGGATQDPSLILGSLEWALCNQPDLGRWLIESQKVPQAFLEAFLTSFLKFRWAPL